MSRFSKKRAEKVIAEAYQVIGVLYSDLGDDKGAACWTQKDEEGLDKLSKLLDNLAYGVYKEMDLHKDVLPFPSLCGANVEVRPLGKAFNHKKVKNNE